MNVLVFLDGVMRNSSGAPVPQGVALFRALQAQRRALILCGHKERTEIWLRENKIVQIDDLVSANDLNIDSDLRLVEHCRSKGPIDLVVTADLELSKELIEQGLTTILFLSPKYFRPEFRPDGARGIKSWADLQAEVDRQDDLYREDPRA
jgi:hypothetical protein